MYIIFSTFTVLWGNHNQLQCWYKCVLPNWRQFPLTHFHFESSCISFKQHFRVSETTITDSLRTNGGMENQEARRGFLPSINLRRSFVFKGSQDLNNPASECEIWQGLQDKSEGYVNNCIHKTCWQWQHWAKHLFATFWGHFGSDEDGQSDPKRLQIEILPNTVIPNNILCKYHRVQ